MTTVCVITSVHHAYDGRIYYKQCQSLQKSGYRVVLIAPRPEQVEHANGVELIPFDKPKSRLKRFLTGFHIYKLAKKTDADIYHFHDPDLLFVGALLRKRTKKPVIYDVHEHYPNAIMGRVYIPKWLRRIVKIGYEVVEQICLRFISGVIYTTDEIGERYSHYVNCKIENFPLKEMFHEQRHLQKDESLIIYLGGITEIRGVIQLLEGFAQVIKKFPNAKLMFVGFFESTTFENKVMDLISRLNLHDNVSFTGRVPYTEINRYVEKAAIGVLPYLPVPNHLVALPNKLIEYMAAGNAVIASDFPHYRRIVETSRCGVLVNPEEPNDIASAMAQLLEHPDVTKKLGMQARQAFLTRYNWDYEEKKLIAFYKQLLGREMKDNSSNF